MNNIFNVLNKKVTGSVPVTPHWWGLYKFTLDGLVSGYEDQNKGLDLSSDSLMKYDELFYNTFKPDMFHLGAGASGNTDFEKLKQAELLKNSVNLLESKAHIDEYMSLLERSEAEILQGGEFEHVKKISDKYGTEALIAVNEGLTIGAYLDPYGHAGFEQGLIGMLEETENSAYFLGKVYENILHRVRALSKLGCHAYISSETYCSCDILSPQLYKDVIFPLQDKYFKEIKKLGIIPIAYFTGDINPITQQIKQLSISAMMVEESKKGFTLSPKALASQLEGEITLFGNLDSIDILQKGTTDEVKRHTEKMLMDTYGKPFIMANGCPISFDTPQKNIHAMIKTTREYCGNSVSKGAISYGQR